MAAATYNIVIDQGSNFGLSILLQEQDNTPADLTGYTARAQLRKTKNSADITTSFVCAILEPLTGEVLIGLNSAQTKDLEAVDTAGKYYYDLELHTYDDGVVIRVVQGDVTVSREVTR